MNLNIGVGIMPLPYIVSTDIRLLLNKWAHDRGFTIPDQRFFNDLRDGLRNELIYALAETATVELVPEEELANGMDEIIRKSGLPPISLDRTYVQSKFKIDLCRWVDAQGESLGEHPRAGSAPLSQQLQVIEQSGIKEAILIDDVVFTGGLIVQLIDSLAKVGITVRAVGAGIGIGMGTSRIKDLGIPVRCVREYAEVLDEICERDFYPGIPFSGRTMINSNGVSIGAPYILPYGRPVEWASIPEKQARSFSDYCCSATRNLFLEIGHLSGRPIRCCDLDRSVIGLPYDETTFADVIYPA